MSARGSRGELVFVGDVHLERDDPDLGAFLAFLERLGQSSSRIVLLGDLFNLWIGRPELEQPHQKAVLASGSPGCARRGIVVRYLEGNRDYRIGPCLCRARARGRRDGDRGIVGAFRRPVGSWAIHGDLANPDDRRYRRWHRLSRSRLVWVLFHLLPRARRMRLAERLEVRMRESNPAFKGRFPEAVVRDYAVRLLGSNDDALVLGHFHVEKDLALEAGAARRRVLVLPDWKRARRHLRVDSAGAIEFVDSDV